MMPIPEQCREAKTAVNEKGRRFALLNPCGRHVRRVHVDGCVFKGEEFGKRCDFLFEVDRGKPNARVLFVELKGTDLTQAADQLGATITQLRDEYKGCRLEAYIVAAKVPKAGPSVQKLQTKMLLKHRVDLFIKSDRAEVSICP